MLQVPVGGYVILDAFITIYLFSLMQPGFLFDAFRSFLDQCPHSGVVYKGKSSDVIPHFEEQFMATHWISRIG
jgi:hypothetical protein